MLSYESLKKSDLETALDDFIAQHSDRLAKRSDLSSYFASRAKALGSPVKKESDVEKTLKVAKRRVTKVAEEIEYVFLLGFQASACTRAVTTAACLGGKANQPLGCTSE